MAGRLLLLLLLAHHAAAGVKLVTIAAPSVNRSAEAEAAGFRLESMCRLAPQCLGPHVVQLPPLHRPNFFRSPGERDLFCGSPGGFVEGARVATKATKALLRRDETWETPWGELRHLADPRTCVASVTATRDAPEESGEGSGDERAARELRGTRGQKKGPLEAARAAVKGSFQQGPHLSPCHGHALAHALAHVMGVGNQ